LYARVLANALNGVFHAAARRWLSLYQIAQIINRVGGYDPKCLMGTPRHAAGPIPPRAGNVCMDCGKLIRALGFDPFDPWPYCDALVPTHAGWHCERPADEARSPAELHRVLAANPNVAGQAGRARLTSVTGKHVRRTVASR
jgi:dTDP-4-dehydrorhamnose reductase